MMRKLMLIAAVALMCVACKDGARQSDSFVIQGKVCLPDGYMACLAVETDTAFSVILCDSVFIKDGQFEMKGRVDRPLPGTLMTNNLVLVARNGWPTDSIRWTYSDVFVTNGRLQFVISDQSGDSPQGRLTGTQVQADYNDLKDMGGQRDADPWAFIERHPHSAVSVWLACQLTNRAYRLTSSQVELLAQTITQCPADTMLFSRLKEKLAAARLTTLGAPLQELELVDTQGNTCQLTDVVPHDGRYVLVDFWASWCGICLHAMPDVVQLCADFKDRLGFVGVSVDTDAQAWQKAMAKHAMPCPQYRTTAAGLQTMTTTYQVGNGVPYYLLVDPDGHVVMSPEHSGDVREYLLKLNK